MLTSTYRLQFGPDFSLKDALSIVDYLHGLGISHVYASPFLKARKGSTHGYDVVDYGQINPEIGDQADLAALANALAARGMGQILDFVPNHMGVGRADNPWWLDVLEWGQLSPFAHYFDIDWEPSNPALRGKLVLPVLGDHYGAILEQGDITLRFDAEAGAFSAWYFEHRLPIGPRHYPLILDRLDDDAVRDELAALTEGFRQLRHEPRRSIYARGVALKRELAALAKAARVGRSLQRAAESLNGVPGNPESFVPLHRILQVQAYRVAYWRVASDEINYRRFFNINDLAGIRMEAPDLFEEAHRLVFRMIEAGQVQGLRIDHIDGLLDPEQYIERLQTSVSRLIGGEPGRFYVLVEKILAQHERLRENWLIAGTTGYEFLNQMNGLFVDPAGERALNRLYRRFVGFVDSFDDVAYEGKVRVMVMNLASELHVLANELNRLSESSWYTRDHTLNGLRNALREVVGCFPVYRTYVTPRGAHADDRQAIDWAIVQARKRSRAADKSVFDFIQEVLTGDLARRRGSGYSPTELYRLAMKFQQYTGPVMAKGLEDTSFYRYNRLLSLNEVGGDPRRFGLSIAALHKLNQERATRWPLGMLSSTTHDTKRGEDARARLNVISEMPEEWGRHVRRWSVLNARRKPEVGGKAAPSPNEEYHFYQALVGSWPLELRDELDLPVLGQYRERLEAYAVKALREAKNNTSWANSDSEYEDAVLAFLRRILDASRPNPFLDSFRPLQRRIAAMGMLNGLAQTVLKLTAPGIPDIYRGCELWDFNFVDPDNRQPVDFELRRRLLAGIDGNDPAEMLEHWADGRIKLYLIRTLLQLRRSSPLLFREGLYIPLAAYGALSEHVFAFARQSADSILITIVPRLCSSIWDGLSPFPSSTIWQDTGIQLGPAVGRDFQECLTGRSLQAPGDRLSLQEGLAVLPVALLRAV